MARNAGKYRYRLTIEKRNATTNVWATYGYALAKIRMTSNEMIDDEKGTKAIREYDVMTPYNPSLTIGTVGYRFQWTVQGATRDLYIYGVDTDEETFQDESMFTCSEVMR